jgi:hypothetical protein
MIKKISFLIILIMITTTIAVYSNTKISAQHKYLDRDGKRINCIYCHSGDAKIIKKKGQLKDNSLNGVDLSEIKSCAGGSCH